MNILIIGLWFLMFVGIPIAVILVAGNTYGRDETLLIIGKILISVFVYLVGTVMSYMFSVLMVAELRYGQPLSLQEQIVALAAVYFYGLVGYLLYSFVNGSFLNLGNSLCLMALLHKTVNLYSSSFC